jgi:hypothetical protein
MEAIDLFVKDFGFVRFCLKEGRISILRSARGKLIALKTFLLEIILLYNF